MGKNSNESGNVNLLKQFAAKSNKKQFEYNDRTVIYDRCSSARQDSLGWQDDECLLLVKEKKLNLIRTFGEKESATTDDRPEFKAMLKFCDKENIDNIVIYSYDRFSRAGDIKLLDKLREKGIRIHAVKQIVDDQTASGRQTQAQHLLNAKYENEQRGEKIVAGQTKKLRKGEWNVKPTIGYVKRFIAGEENLPLAKKQCFIDEKYGPLIRQAFYWKFYENISHVEIISRLATMGLTLSLCRLTRIFKNPFYCGYISSSYLDGELIPGKHEALISVEIFLAVNGIVNESQRHGYKNISRIDKMPLKGAVKCGKCERPLTAYFQKKAYIYYKCPNTGCCVNVSEKKLRPLFNDELSKITLVPNFIPTIKTQLETAYQMLRANETARVKPMKDEMTKLKNELEAMELNLVLGKISSELFQKYSASHKHKIQVIEEELEILGRNSSNFIPDLDKVLHYASNLLEMWEKSEWEGKVRLQKLVFPEGLLYMPENHSLRTISVNPIFLEIASISNDLTSKKEVEKLSETEILRQLYLRFPSSNFFWENLEKIADLLTGLDRDVRLSLNPGISTPVVSMTGSTDARTFRYVSGSTVGNVSSQEDIEQYFQLGGGFSGDKDRLGGLPIG